MIAAGQPQNQMYRAQEQEKKPTPLPQPSGADAVQPNAQPQTFATLQRQGYARPAQPQPAPQQQTAQYGGQMAQQTAMPQSWQSGSDGQSQWQGQMPSQPVPQAPTFNGFNGQAPNFNPLDYMVGQMMQPGQQTNFGGMAQGVPSQNYAPTSAPNFQGAQTNYGAGGGAYGNISVQGGGGGVAANYQGNALNPYDKSTFDHQGGPVADAAQQKILDLMNKPSGWDSNLVQSMYGTMGNKIDDQFAQQDTAINEEMAKRGLYDSSIAAGRLKDSNIGRRDAKTNLADSLLQQMGLNYGNDQARAAGLGTAYQGQQFGEAAQGFGLNQGAEQQAFGQRLGAEQAAQGAFGMNQAGQIANSNAGIASMQANLQAQQANQRNAFDYAGLNSQNALANNGQLLDRARFQSGENQFATNTFNNNAQQRFQNQMAGGQQDFNNDITNTGLQRDMLGNIVNYGQQQFNNDMTQGQFNRQLSNDTWQQYLDTLGLR